MSPLSSASYKGTRDFFPADMRFRNWMFGKMRETVERFGYEEYNAPLLEAFELYAAKTGEEIVNQQLYWLIDRGERKLAIRPEMTPSLARMVAQKFHELPRPVRWYSIGNFWRYERPQRGRLREFFQLNVDVLGGDAFLADLEILQVALEIVGSYGGREKIQIKLNHRGLVDHFFSKTLGLSAEKALSVTKAIDARAKIGEEAYRKWLVDLGLADQAIEQIGKFFSLSFSEIAERFPCEGSKHLSRILERFQHAPITFDATVLRGLDYYTGMVFEVYDVSPENHRAMFGGGRYDNLVGLFNEKQSLSGVGFGMGDVVLENFLEVHGLKPKIEAPIDVFVSLPSEAGLSHTEEAAQLLRVRGFRVAVSLEPGSFGGQLKQASKLGARFAVLFGEEEWKSKQVILKDLTKGTQNTVLFSALSEELKRSSLKNG